MVRSRLISFKTSINHRKNKLEDEVKLIVEGLGLGLYITRLIVEAFKGKIELTSKLGIGSAMTVTLPIHSNIQHTEKELLNEMSQHLNS